MTRKQRSPEKRELILIGAPERIVPQLPDTLRCELEELGGEGFRLVGIAVAEVPVSTVRIADVLPSISERSERGADGGKGSVRPSATSEQATSVEGKGPWGNREVSPRFLGVFLLRDPLRPDAARALAEARAAGIRTVMVTGDYPATAARIARDVGLGENPRVCTGDALSRMSDTELRDRLSVFDVFARTVPEQKLRLVRAWRERGAVLAVTGDGVNDAPALIGADVGVAMGSGTDVAREASDLVLMNDHYATIVAGVAGGRVIWDNLRKVTAYLLASSFSEVVLVGGALAFGVPVPILPAQILWVNLVEDLLPAAALAWEPAERGVMREPPRPRGEPLLSRELRTLIFGVGIASDVVLLAVALAVLRATGDLTLTRTIMFGGLGIDALVFVFGIRSLREPIWRSRPTANPHLLIAVAVAALLLVAGLAAPVLRPILRTAPLPAWGWGLIAAIGVVELLAVEGVKAVFRKRPRGGS